MLKDFSKQTLFVVGKEIPVINQPYSCYMIRLSDSMIVTTILIRTEELEMINYIGDGIYYLQDKKSDYYLFVKIQE